MLLSGTVAAEFLTRLRLAACKRTLARRAWRVESESSAAHVSGSARTFAAMLGLLLVHLSLVTPFDPLHGDGYQFVSGIGSDFGEVTLLGAVLAWWHHNNCIEKGCWRKGHKSPDHGHPVCRKHTQHEHPAFGP